MDAKATVKIGSFSRGGKNRVPTSSYDHDYQPSAKLTPYGILLPELDELFFYFTESKVTADFIVDVLEQWWMSVKNRFSQIRTLLINQDNGGENSSRRTQFMKRLVEFAHHHQLHVRLAYYPPYHSKYNPIERTWAILEHHWNGSILDSVETAINFAQTMTWKGKNPQIKLVKTNYPKGVRLTKPEMNEIESQIQRLPLLPNWFVDIFPVSE
jgi:transposase